MTEKSEQAAYYLDANATTAMSEAARAAVNDVFSMGPLNPSSDHSNGFAAREVLTSARDESALLFGDADPDDIVFTSGGTEGNWIAINAYRASRTGIVIGTATDHTSVHEPVTALGGRVVGVDDNGIVRIDELVEAACGRDDAPMICLNWVNSETGVIQPMGEIVSAVRYARPDAIILADAAQAVGRIPLVFDGVDFVTCSAHKLHGPQGVGLLYISDHAKERVSRYYSGAGQEFGWRPGTENVPGAAGLAAAFRERRERFEDHLFKLRRARDRFEAIVLSELRDVRINGADASRVVNTSSVTLPAVDGMQLLAKLDSRGVRASMGSACSSAKPEPSRVLRAMGLSDSDAYSTIRFSFSVMNTTEEAETSAEILIELVKGN